MKYPYIVKYNGVYYPAGAEVPDGKSDESRSDNAQKIVDVPAPEPEPKPEPENEPEKDFQPVPKYNKNALNRMPVMELRNVALEAGIKDVANKTGGQLKAELIELFGL